MPAVFLPLLLALAVQVEVNPAGLSPSGDMEFGDGQYAGVVESMMQLASAHPVVVFKTNSCPFSQMAMGELKRQDIHFESIEVNSAMRQGLRLITGRTSVPAVFVAGQYIGGCNDGGLGGVMPLSRSGKLAELVEAATN